MYITLLHILILLGINKVCKGNWGRAFISIYEERLLCALFGGFHTIKPTCTRTHIHAPVCTYEKVLHIWLWVYVQIWWTLRRRKHIIFQVLPDDMYDLFIIVGSVLHQLDMAWRIARCTKQPVSTIRTVQREIKCFAK